MLIKGEQRRAERGRWAFCLAAWLLSACFALPIVRAQYGDVTVPGPDPQFAPPQMPIKYEDPQSAPTQSQSTSTQSQPAAENPNSAARSWPWPSSGINALRAAVGAVTPTNEQLPAPQSGQPAPAALPVVNGQEPVNPQAAVGNTISTLEPKQHHLSLGQPVPKDVVIKDDQGLISLMVRDAPLRQVVALVAETQNLNIVFASPADVPVTASFDRVPWQQVIEALLSISGHTWTMSDDIVFITNIEAADFVTPEAGGRAVEVFELDFASAVDVDQTVQGLLSPAGKSWVIESSTEDNRRTREVVAVVDYPANLARISDYVCQVDQPPRQVLIEANILQVELSDDCKNGVNFQNLVSFSGNTVDFRSVGFANEASTSAFFMEVDGGALDGLVELLKTTTDAKALATPKIMAVSGQQSHIQIGSQLGFRVTTTTQTGTFESIQFLDVGVVLTVTPRITRDGRVLMRVKPKVSTGQVDAGTGLPSEDTTEVETDILLNNGQGMVIGGLIQESDTNTQSKIPWFGDLPYVGVLFQKRQVIKERSEIIVTLIPHVMPYSPMIAEREQHEFMRAEDRLTYGALQRNPRTYEPRLHDTFTNPRRPVANAMALHNAHRAAGHEVLPGDIIALPPVDGEHHYEEYEMLPEVEGELEIPFPVEQSSYNAPMPTATR
jgi:type IV pilus assembly protein PilQ